MGILIKNLIADGISKNKNDRLFMVKI